MSEFIGRSEELVVLRTIIGNPEPTIGVVYGRRRIGKSRLIRKSLEGKNALFFEGLENRPRQAQITNFLFQLEKQTGGRNDGEAIKTWTKAFVRLYEYVKEKPCHICLDEFQWTANYRSEVVAELKMAWEQYLSTVPGLTLILCGSIASFMVTKVLRSSALYGRTNAQIHLKPFSLTETAAMLAGRGTTELLEAQMFTDGIPRYLELLADGPSVRLSMGKQSFSDSGYFVDEFDRIFVSHFGKHPVFERIIQYLSEHPYGRYRKQIAEALGVTEGGLLSNHLGDLESAGFISSQTPFNRDSSSRHIRYYLTDAYMRFYFAFIKPNIKKIRSGMHKDQFARISQSPAFAAWLGRSFEHLCINHGGRIASLLGFSGIDFTAGPYFNPRDEKTEGVQIDLLFDRADKVITLCEMKHRVKPVGMEVLKEVERKVEVLATRFPGRTIQKVLITTGEPGRELCASGYFYRILRADELFDPV